MPTHSGIKLSLVSYQHFLTLPEIDHPETSQFTKRSPSIANIAIFDSPSDIKSTDSKADRLLGRKTSVSVYVPSTPGMRFWIRLQILEPFPETTPYLFCKLLMNGRHVQSLGYPAEDPAIYRITKGLFDPSEKYNYVDEKGVAFKSCGLEQRAFYFSEESARSTSQDGGVIEVQLFRAKGREQKVQAPVALTQGSYGLVLASGNLVEDPQNAKFYHWHLKDPKENPYVTVKFYYRSWKTLKDLHIIPQNNTEHGLLTTPSLLSLAGLSRKSQFELDEERFKEAELQYEKTKLRLALMPSVDEDESIIDYESDECQGEDESEDEACKHLLGVEKNDDDLAFGSDVEYDNPHPISIDDSDADKQDNEDGKIECLAGEEEQATYHAYEPLQDLIDFIERSNFIATSQDGTAPSPSSVATQGVVVSGTLRDRVPTPYNHEHALDEEEEGDSRISSILEDYKSDFKLSPKKMDTEYLNRPLPEPPLAMHPVRVSSLRKSAKRRSLKEHHHPSLSEMSQAQSNTTDDPASEVSLGSSMHARAASHEMSKFPEFDTARIVRYQSPTKMVDTPPRTRRESLDSVNDNESKSPIDTSPIPTSKFSTFRHPRAPTRTAPSIPRTDDSLPLMFEAENLNQTSSLGDVPIGTAISPPSPYTAIGTAICPPSPYAAHNNQPAHPHEEQTHLAPLLPPINFAHPTHAPPKNIVVPSSAAEAQLSTYQRCQPLSPISEMSSRTTTPDQRRASADNFTNVTLRHARARTSSLNSVVSSMEHAIIQEHSRDSLKDEYAALRRTPKYEDLRSTPPLPLRKEDVMAEGGATD